MRVRGVELLDGRARRLAAGLVGADDEDDARRLVAAIELSATTSTGGVSMIAQSKCSSER